MKRYQKHIDTITVQDDHGMTHQLRVYQTFIESTTSSGTSTTPGLKTIINQDGHSVNVVDFQRGEFLVVQTNTPLKRV